MRVLILFYGFFYLLFITSPLSVKGNNPFNNINSSLNFNDDVVAHFDPDKSDRDCDIAVAFNGWMYMAYSSSHSGPTGTDIGFLISKDNGLTWLAFPPIILGNHNDASIYDILVTGSDTSSLRVYLSYYFNNASFSYSFGHVIVYDGISGQQLPYGIDIGDGTYSIGEIHLASDFRHPSSVSKGYSVAIVYSSSVGDFTNTDSLICLISTDSSNNNYSYNLIDTSTSALIKSASIDYGFSAANNSGGYYIAYQKGLNIGYSKNSFSIASGFTNPIYLNQIINIKGANFESPKIACQNSFGSNDSSGLSVMIMAKAFDSTITNTYRIPWIVYNMNAASSDYWFSSGVSNSVYVSSVETYDISYSESENRFWITGFNNDSGNLFTALEDFNFSHQGNWFIADTQYNDTLIDPLIPPNPRITTSGNFVYVAWVSHIFGSTGQPRSQTLFDKMELPFSTNIQDASENVSFTIYPNPANDDLILFQLPQIHSSKIKTIKIYDGSGRVVFSENFNFQLQLLHINTREFKSGMYFFQILTLNDDSFVEKIIIQHQ